MPSRDAPPAIGAPVVGIPVDKTWMDVVPRRQDYPLALVIGGSSAGLSAREGQLRPGSCDVIVGGYSSIEDLLTIGRKVRRRAEREERYHGVDRCQLAFKEHRAPLISEHKRESSKKQKTMDPSLPGPRRPLAGPARGEATPTRSRVAVFLFFSFSLTKSTDPCLLTPWTSFFGPRTRHGPEGRVYFWLPP